MGSDSSGCAAPRRRTFVTLLVGVLLLADGVVPAAHEIPVDVVIQTYVKPDGERLHLLIRLPLRAMRDIDFPTRGPGYLDLDRADVSLRDAAALWVAGNIGLYENDAPVAESRLIATRVSLPSDRSFDSYEGAVAHVTGSGLPDETEIHWEQAVLDVLFEYSIRSERSEFSIQPSLARLGLRVVTVLRFVSPGGAVRVLEYSGDPGLVRLDPRWHQAAGHFVRLGFVHILEGTDHLLFLLCLVIPFRRFRSLVLIVTSFTVAHSITIIASAYGAGPATLWFPPLVETLIAMSIIYMALENIVSAGSVQRRWLITFAFGLIHGFGFSFALRETLQFAGSHVLASLLAFNLGVELGQLLVLVLLVPALHVLFRYVVAERIGTIVLSALVAHTGWHWMTERGGQLMEFGWTAVDPAALASLMRWMMVLVIVVGAAWLSKGGLRHPAGRRMEGALDEHRAEL